MCRGVIFGEASAFCIAASRFVEARAMATGGEYLFVVMVASGWSVTPGVFAARNAAIKSICPRVPRFLIKEDRAGRYLLLRNFSSGLKQARME